MAQGLNCTTLLSRRSTLGQVHDPLGHGLHHPLDASHSCVTKVFCLSARQRGFCCRRNAAGRALAADADPGAPYDHQD
jgi:hypothetical protein